MQFIQFIQFQVLETVVYPWVRENYEDANICYLFQQVVSKPVNKFESNFLMFLSFKDGAPPHTGDRAQELCEELFQDYVPKDSWPPSSPDLGCNSMHFIKMSMKNTFAEIIQFKFIHNVK